MITDPNAIVVGIAQGQLTNWITVGIYTESNISTLGNTGFALYNVWKCNVQEQCMRLFNVSSVFLASCINFYSCFHFQMFDNASVFCSSIAYLPFSFACSSFYMYLYGWVMWCQLWTTFTTSQLLISVSTYHIVEITWLFS